MADTISEIPRRKVSLCNGFKWNNNFVLFTKKMPRISKIIAMFFFCFFVFS